MIAHKLTDKTGPVIALHQVGGEEEMVLISEEGKAVRTTVGSVRHAGRSTQGVTVMDAGAGAVAAVAVVDTSREFGQGVGAEDEAPTE